MKKIISVLVENKAGVLARIAGLFGRRGFNIASLTVGETEDSDALEQAFREPCGQMKGVVEA